MTQGSFRRASVVSWICAAGTGLVAALAVADMSFAASVRVVPAVAAPADMQPQCTVVSSEDRFEHSLLRTSRHLVSGRPIKIVAIGSSSTAGAGASSPQASYPSRLSVELNSHYPGHEFTVLNRGVNGEEAPDMLARFETGVVAEHPDMVIWQVGTNWVLRDRPIDPHATVLHEGLARLKAIHADIVMLDPQYAPKVNDKPETDSMVAQIALTAKEENVDLFHRYLVMKHWYEVDHLPFDTFVASDGLHMNDWGYACLAKWLGGAIEEAATRPIAMARQPLH